MIPDFLGSISTGLKYKNWSLNISLDMRFGGKVASYNSRYGTAYGFMEESLKGTPGHGGVTWTSKFDGKTYNDGIIPQGIIRKARKSRNPMVRSILLERVECLLPDSLIKNCSIRA